ncbi:hypothetical protein [Nonomuraea fuscirosea]|uniref:hypothetical protein n=1 Tax=Nonomuraea fuscirosea TaxID=1291556 RepID=UPI0033DFA26D
MITMMWWDHSGMNNWSYALMILSALLLWGLLVTVIVLAVRQASTSARTGPEDGSASPAAEELLARRFARGEIDAEQYRAGLELLRGRHDHPSAT